MQVISLLMMMSLVIGGVAVIWSIYDLQRQLSARRTLVHSLSRDPEFMQCAPHVWECDWRDQCDDEQLKRLRRIIRQHIHRLDLRHSADVLLSLDQAHLINRFHYVRSLVRDAESKRRNVQ